MDFKALAASAALSVVLCTGAFAQSAEDLKMDASTPGDILTYGMGQGQQRFSPLDQINRDTVKRLVPVWNYSLNDSRGQETFPLVKDGVMYVTTHNSTAAIDAHTGKQIWKTMVEYPAETPRVACCGIVNRGAALYEGKLFRTTLDANVVALDAATGKEVWKTNSIDFKTGYSMTVAPLIADGVLIVGVSGGEYGVRGYIEGYNPENGERLWRTYTIPEPGQPGSETWPKDSDAWKNGGGPAWLTGTFDPELDTVYWGVGNAGPWNASVRPGDNLYTGSMLALNPKTGEIKWHYQFTPNDPFDYDGTNELVMADMDGKKVVMQANRNGFFYVIDRTNGKLLAANKFVDRVDWAEKIDLETGKPVQTQLAADARSGKQVEYWPSAFGGKNWSPMSYNPDMKTAFANTLNIGMNYKAVEPQYRAGVFYFGADFSWAWPEGDRGYLRAIDPMTGATKWKNGTAIPRLAGVLSTGGGLVFTGQMTGEFEAFNSETGDRLWQFQTGSGIVGQPVTWEMDGQQYVTVASGVGAVYALFSGDERLANIPAGGSIWTFKLMGE
ncbi:PQQ-dependent dehydrogenase, methanol/ethanol family [Zhengella mangrovi]|uniref:PQQ-dependent dehydrogenase, methanol/ethanol family n=1 Tax=Zhengella mangrovi TaxID=1982044 RepID=A0A2G1QHK0_9HYPH|nr:PQQ-dependent dehydrogenase, methanol/ethanol family [Zhengella mangrovi]PHP64931.1 PQQ-dependent dehydrogenase, methanol/ethanol family [Zhengella mangrovi]